MMAKGKGGWNWVWESWIQLGENVLGKGGEVVQEYFGEVNGASISH